ncbi:NAD(P)-binding domain-containing protein [Streptomyces tricolor]|nr:NAD(P)-binding domain-containing protein [Streptomyces tricolor]
MDVVARECRWTTGRSPRTAAPATPPCSPPSASTRACAPPPSTCGATPLRGRKVGIAGVGKVGHHLVRHLRDEGAEVVITDVRPDAVQRILDAHPEGVTAVADTERLIRVEGLTSTPRAPSAAR